jgi:hypothetical protein
LPTCRPLVNPLIIGEWVPLAHRRERDHVQGAQLLRRDLRRLRPRPSDGRSTLDLEFNLTVVVTPRSNFMHACAYPGATSRVSYHVIELPLWVSYHGIELASTAVPKFYEAWGRTLSSHGAIGTNAGQPKRGSAACRRCIWRHDHGPVLKGHEKVHACAESFMHRDACWGDN